MTTESNLAYFDGGWTQKQLQNGIRVVHVPLSQGDTRFFITAMFSRGCLHETPQQPGITHLLEHMMFRGSRRYPTFASLSQAFEVLGGEWNAATGHEYTEFFYQGVSRNAAKSIELLADFLIYPCLNDLETERKIVIRELDSELNEQGENTDVDYHAMRLVWPGSMMKFPIIGTKKSLESIKVEDLRAYLTRHYTCDNLIISVVGGERDVIFNTIENYFAEFRSGSSKGREASVPAYDFGSLRHLHVDHSDNEYTIQISYPCAGTGARETASYEILTRLLGDGFSSRLVKRIREELGLTYDISTSYQQFDHGGVFTINTSVMPENLQLLLDEIQSSLRLLAAQPVTSEELERLHSRIDVDLELLSSDPAQSGFRIAWQLLKNQDTSLAAWRKRLHAVTAEEIMDVARTLFRDSNKYTVILGPKELT